RTLTCGAPPTGCHGVGMCVSNETCDYPVKVGQQCGSQMVCYGDAGCDVVRGIVFNYVPSNFDPTQVPTPPTSPTLVPDGGQITINTTSGTIGTGWGSVPPNVGTITLQNG